MPPTVSSQDLRLVWDVVVLYEMCQRGLVLGASHCPKRMKPLSHTHRGCKPNQSQHNKSSGTGKLLHCSHHDNPHSHGRCIAPPNTNPTLLYSYPRVVPSLPKTNVALSSSAVFDKLNSNRFRVNPHTFSRPPRPQQPHPVSPKASQP